MNTLLLWLGWGVLRVHWGRFLAAALSIAIGVALGLAIHLVNRSALEEFAAAMDTVHGEASLQLKARQGQLAEQAFATIKLDPAVDEASPVIELDEVIELKGQPLKIKIIGLDFFRASSMHADLIPQQGIEQIFSPDSIYLNQHSLQSLGLKVGEQVQLLGTKLMIAGSLSPRQDRINLAVMDIGSLQWLITRPDTRPSQPRLQQTPPGPSRPGAAQLSRVDLRLSAGTSLQNFKRRIESNHPTWVLTEPKEALSRVSNLSRAYRVNLNVLALVALVSGGFMVYATMSLAVRHQAKQQALLSILGAAQSFGRTVVLWQGAAVGIMGSALGCILGVLLAQAVLSLVGGDLGGGYFVGSRPSLQIEPWAMLGFFCIGIAISLLGSLVPAWQLSKLIPAQALREGLNAAPQTRAARLLSPLTQNLSPLTQNLSPLTLDVSPQALKCLFFGLPMIVGLCFAPPVFGIPLAAYLAIGLAIILGVMLVPFWVGLTSHLLAPRLFFNAEQVAYWLATQRLGRFPANASAAVAGIVASFALASAMAIMVHSFRNSVDQWLGTVLPADLYLRLDSKNPSAAPHLNGLSPAIQTQIENLPGVKQIQALRTTELTLSQELPSVGIIARAINFQAPSTSLPLTGPFANADELARIIAQARVPIFVSEAMIDLYGWKLGSRVKLPLLGMSVTQQGQPIFEVVGIWRDYVRQQGSIVMDRAIYQGLTGDSRIDDLLIWLSSGSSREQEIAAAIRSVLGDQPVSIRSTREIRQLSLQMFDRSFALTYVLEAIAVLGALFGVASTYSGEALARAREFGMLRHLGLTRVHITGIFMIETGVMLVLATLWGLLLSLGLAWILIHRVNPQSFHWTMDTSIPWGMLGLSALLVLILGVITSWLATRSATRQGPILAVREDW